MKNRYMLSFLICVWLFVCSCAKSELPNQLTDVDASLSPDVTERQDEPSPISAVSSAQKSGGVLHQTCVAELDGDDETDTVELWFVQMGEYVNLTEGDGPLTQFWYPVLRLTDHDNVCEYIFDSIPVSVRSTHLFPIASEDGTKTKIVVSLECGGSGSWQRIYVFDYDAEQCQWTNLDLLQPKDFSAYLNADMTVSVLYASGEADSFTPTDEWQRDWRDDNKSDPNSVVYPVALTHGGIIDSGAGDQR